MKVAEKIEARRLRCLGHSIKDICRLLGVSKGSVSLWVKDIRLTDAQVDDLNCRIARNRQRFSYLSRCLGANTNRQDALKRHSAYRQGGYERAQTDEKFRLICALYWGEGSKSNQGVFAVSNCDPTLLRVVLKWLLKSPYAEKICFHVQYYEENGLPEGAIKGWWLEQLPGIEARNLRKFSRCVLNRASQRKKVGKQPYGTGTVAVYSTELFFTVMGGIDFLRQAGDW
jgi:hypothetical protein